MKPHLMDSFPPAASSRAHARPRRAPALALVLAGALLPAQDASDVHVAHSGTSVVSVLEPTPGSVLATIPVSAPTGRVAVSADGSRAYYTHGGVAQLTVVDAVQRTVAGTIPLPGAASGVALSAVSPRGYASAAGGYFTTFDTATHEVLSSTVVGANGDLALTPDGTRAFLAAGSVFVVDTSSGELLSTFLPQAEEVPGVSVSAESIVMSPDGTRAHVGVSSFNFGGASFSAGGGVAVIDTATEAVIDTLWIGSLPGPMAITPDGSRVYVCVDATWADTGYGAGFLPGRTVIVLDALAGTVAAMIDLGAAGANWTLQNTGRGIAVAADRSAVYVSIPRLQSVAVADVNTNRVVTTIPVALGPLGLGVQPASVPLVPYLLTAGNDSATISSDGGTAVPNVLSNDRLGGLPVTTAHVSLAEVSSSEPGVSLDVVSGAVEVAPGASLGVHTLVYRICELADPANCAEATATITVRAPHVIDAVDDSARTYHGRTALANVLANDTLNGAAATTAQVAITLVSSPAPGINLVPTTGAVTVATGTPPGLYTLVYRICERASPGNCDEASVTVQVDPFPIVAAEDAGTVTRSGGTAVANVLSNDTFNGGVATLARVSLAIVSSSSPALNLNTANGAVTVAQGAPLGSHTLRYRICEIASPTNCVEATVTVTVGPYLILAVNDSARGSSKLANTPLASVLANDTLGGVRATTATVRISMISLTPANSKIRLDTTDGSVDVLGKTSSGIYTMVYEIAEIAQPTNTSRATVTIDLSGK